MTAGPRTIRVVFGWVKMALSGVSYGNLLWFRPMLSNLARTRNLFCDNQCVSSAH